MEKSEIRITNLILVRCAQKGLALILAFSPQEKERVAVWYRLMEWRFGFSAKGR